MLTVTQLPNGKLSIKADYFYRDRIKQIPTAQFNFDTKQWIIEDFMLGQLEHDFQGELVYKTPRWVILRQPMPDMSAMYQITDTSIQAPSLKLNPYDYQDYGIRFMVDKILKRGFVLNADDVGLGKTIQTIASLKWFIENHNTEKILIICKKSIKKQWIDEIKKFTDLDNTFTFTKTGSTAAQRKKAYAEFEKAQKGVLVTNYHSFLNDTPLFEKMKIDFVVIDEVHSVKARAGKLNNNIARITSGKPTIFLTGTPIMSRPEDIFGIVQMVDPSYFGKWAEFQKEYLTIDYNGRFGMRVAGARNLDKLRNLVQDIVIRRTEYEVSIQLPKTIIIQNDCQMDSTQEKILVAIAEKTEDIATQMDAIKNNKFMDEMVKYEKLTQLEGNSKGLIAARQAASTDPRLFLTSPSKMMRDTFGQFVPASYKMSDKTECILDTVQDIVDAGDKVILFTKFRTCASMIADDIQKILKENVLLYTGAEDDAARDMAVDYFKNTTTYNILIGTEAMAEGLNLQCARYVINIDQPDTLAIKTQRIGRARRAGSAFDNVVVYDMITNSTPQARSKDEERIENIAKNADLTDALVSIDEAQRQALINAMSS
jgi:SNF2 family DNA or RNA helicase